MQTKIQSHMEAAADTSISFVVGVIGNYLIFPLLGFPVHITDAVMLTSVFMAVSYIRRYFVRRFFNWMHEATT